VEEKILLGGMDLKLDCFDDDNGIGFGPMKRKPRGKKDINILREESKNRQKLLRAQMKDLFRDLACVLRPPLDPNHEKTKAILQRAINYIQECNQELDQYRNGQMNHNGCTDNGPVIQISEDASPLLHSSGESSPVMPGYTYSESSDSSPFNSSCPPMEPLKTNNNYDLFIPDTSELYANFDTGLPPLPNYFSFELLGNSKSRGIPDLSEEEKQQEPLLTKSQTVKQVNVVTTSGTLERPSTEWAASSSSSNGHRQRAIYNGNGNQTSNGQRVVSAPSAYPPLHNLNGHTDPLSENHTDIVPEQRKSLVTPSSTQSSFVSIGSRGRTLDPNSIQQPGSTRSRSPIGEHRIAQKKLNDSMNQMNLVHQPDSDEELDAVVTIDEPDPEPEDEEDVNNQDVQS